MRKYKVLILTDHSGHSMYNSVYSLASAMLKHQRCDVIYVASRGSEQNSQFFNRLSAHELYGTRVTEEFVYSDEGAFFEKDLEHLKLEDFDFLFMRLPRPISDVFLQGIAKMFYNKVVINDPIGIMTTSTKEFLLNFPGLCPEMKLCYSVDEIIAIASDQSIVLKPLKEYGGKGIVKIINGQVDDGKSFYSLSTFLKNQEEFIKNEGYLAMKYLKNVAQGDKRILVVGGEVMASSLRLPAAGSWLCNVAQGGTSVATEVTLEELEIIHSISPILLAKGILIYGVDTLVNDDGKRVLSEINTLSLGGFLNAQEQSTRPILKMTVDKMIKYADEYYA